MLLATAQSIRTGIVNPDVPRCVAITGTMAGASLTGNVVIRGFDINGNLITDTIALNNNVLVKGVKAFASIYEINVPVRVTALDTLVVGLTDAIGLPELITANNIFMVTYDGAYEATRPTVTKGTAVSDCTVDPATAISDNKELAIYYVAK
jgi:hypothetical protein